MVSVFKDGDRVIVKRKRVTGYASSFSKLCDQGREATVRITDMPTTRGNFPMIRVVFYGLRKNDRDHSAPMRPIDIELAESFITEKAEALEKFSNSLGSGFVKSHKARGMFFQSRQIEVDRDWVDNCLSMDGFNQEAIDQITEWLKAN